MDRQLISFIKKKYPSISHIDDLYISDLFSRIRNDSNARRILIEARQSTLAPMNLDLARQALRNFKLPEGWGDLLLSLTNPLIEQIPGFDFSTLDPSLSLLLKMIIFHALFVNKEGNGRENASSELTRDEAYAESLAGTAQELLDVLRLMPSLRNGGTRLFQRMLSCINNLLETPY